MIAIFTSKWFAALALIVLGLFLVLGIMRRSGCGERERREREPRTKTYGPYEVKAAESGCILVCKHGRRDRTLTIQLEGLTCWPFGHNYDEARKALGQLAGGSVTVEVTKDGWLRADSVDEGVENPALDRASSMTGVVKNAGGICLQLEQIKSGACWIDPIMLEADPKSIPEAWKAAEAEAKKAKRGIWAEGE